MLNRTPTPRRDTAKFEGIRKKVAFSRKFRFGDLFGKHEFLGFLGDFWQRRFLDAEVPFLRVVVVVVVVVVVLRRNPLRSVFPQFPLPGCFWDDEICSKIMFCSIFE